MEPLTHPRDPQEEEQREPGRVGAGLRQESRLVLGAKEFKQDRSTQLVFLKSIPISVVWGWESGEAGTQSGDGGGGS